MIKRTSITVALLSLLTLGSAFAQPQSSSISLADITVPAGKENFVSFDKLYEGVTYKLTCHIKNTAKTHDQFTDVMFNTTYKNINEHLLLDNKEIAFGKIQPIKSDGSMLVMDIVENGMYLDVRNLDYTDDVLLYDCVADLNHD